MEQQLAKAIKELKTRIYTATINAVTDFEEKTGVTPSSIEIQMLDASVVGKEWRRIVGSVRVSLGDF